MKDRSVVPVVDPILDALRNGETRIDLKGYYEAEEDRRPYPLSYVILDSPLHKFFLKRVKNPLRKLLAIISKRIPTPTKENTRMHNSHILIDIRDKFFQYDTTPQNDAQSQMFRAVFNLLIMEVEHDLYYRDRFDWFLDKIRKSDWTPRPTDRAHVRWNEPKEEIL